MVLEVMLLFNSFLLIIALVLLLFAAGKDPTTKKARFKVKDDINKIKEQIMN